MEMRLPKELLEWVDDNRLEYSRQAFMIAILLQVKQNPKHFITQDMINEIHKEKQEQNTRGS